MSRKLKPSALTRRRRMRLESKNVIERLRSEHTESAVRERLAEVRSPEYLRDFMYGAVDGAVTTFAIVAGVVGAGLEAGIVIVLGAANLIADGFSMAASNFLATRSEQQLRRRARREEELHIKAVPEGEREEVRQILAAKGFTEADLDRAVDVITSDDELWLDTMMTDELGYAPVVTSEWRAGASTFAAFVIVGFVPLAAFVYDYLVSGEVAGRFAWSATMTAIAFFGVGALKARFVDMKWWMGGIETLAVGGSAATCAYLIGVLLKDIAGI
ncbi:MAG: VIT1/CCC1 transporter family protein [Actinomycetota bacterium]